MIIVDTKLQNLGSRLRAERLRRNETQALFSGRIGVSVPTLRKMESGDPTVLVGYWSAALEVLDRGGDLDTILAAPHDLFARHDQMKAPPRHRASRRGK
jgi:transcriptional regulator with XRE-family HTH domain